MPFEWEKPVMGTKSQVFPAINRRVQGIFSDNSDKCKSSPGWALPVCPAHALGSHQGTSWGTRSHVETLAVSQESKANEIFQCWLYITHSTKALTTTPKVHPVKWHSFLFYSPQSMHWESAYTVYFNRLTIVLSQGRWWKWFSSEELPFSIKGIPSFSGCICCFLWFPKGKCNTKKRYFCKCEEEKKAPEALSISNWTKLKGWAARVTVLKQIVLHASLPTGSNPPWPSGWSRLFSLSFFHSCLHLLPHC